MRADDKRSLSSTMNTAPADQWTLVLRRLLVALVLQVIIATTHTTRAHSTISITGTSTGKKSTTISGTNLASTDSLVALMDVNYLESVNSAASQPSDAYAYDVQSIDEISDNSLASFRSGVAKSRKQAENQMKALDWWARFASKNTKSRTYEATKGSARTKTASTPPSVYREQPLEQNPILTIRYQLQAIRDKHRLLVTKSVGQLMQLDQKLVDSYKLCLKKNMPLYAGMLYRTRDFVVRMSNEVKQERQVLAAITKQAQRVLRQKAENRTLVKEFNRIASITTDLSAVEPAKSLNQLPAYSQDDVTAHNGGKGKRSADVVSALATSLTRDVASSVVASSALAATSPHRAAKRGDPRSISDEASAKQPPLPTIGNQIATGFLKSSSEGDKISGHNAATMVARNQQRVGTKKSLLDGNNSLLARRHAPVETNLVFSGDASSKSEQLEHLDPDLANSLDDYSPNASSFGSTATSSAFTSTTSSTTRKPKQQTYTVNINEVNLKRELLKTQALIDRINASSVELMGVVDDIVYLFKITSSDYNSRKGLAMSGKTSKYEKIHAGSMLNDIVNNGVDPKRAKKIVKSPFKVLLERFNRLTNQAPANLIATGTGTTISDGTTPVAGVASTRSTSHSDMNSLGENSVEIETNTLPELRPLFDSRSLNVEMDLVDMDLGFDAPAVIETK